MSKAIMRSLPPQQCARIANGEQTIIISKTKPKLETPHKEYIYMTKNGNKPIKVIETQKGIACLEIDYKMAGKVVGEYVCDKVFDIEAYDEFYGTKYGWLFDFDLKDTCLTVEEFEACLSKRKETILSPISGCGLHISQLKIYDNPKELGEFYPSSYCFNLKNVETYTNALDDLIFLYHKNSFCRSCCSYYDGDFNTCTRGLKPLTRPPRVGYVEEV